MSQELIPPRNIQVDETNNNIRIVRKWLDKTLFSYFLPFAIGWNGFMAVVIWILFSSGSITFSSGNITSNIPLMFNIMIGLFILIGIYLIYLIIVKLINKTEIIANDEEVVISHKPLPYLGLKSKQFRVAKLKGFDFKKVNKPGEIPGQYYCYEVYANTHRGSVQKLLTLASSKEADFINQTLETYYKIEREAEDETETTNTSTPSFQSEEKSPIARNDNDANQIEIPKSIQTNQTDGNLSITRKWLDRKTLVYTSLVIFFIFFGVQIFSFISFLISDDFNYSLQDIITIEGTNQVILLILATLLCLSLLGAGVFAIYYVVAKWLNQTRILANEEEILIDHEPLPCPWIAKMRLRTVNLERLYAKRNEKNQSYDVYANTHTGEEKKIITVATSKEALCIERQLEAYYNLKDEYREGEISPSNLTGKSNKIEMPRSIKVYQDDNQIKINQKWDGGAFMATFAILWNVFLIAFGLIIATSENTSGNSSVLFPFFLLFSLVGLCLIYAAVALCLNYTYIVANKELIAVSYGSVPFPFSSNQQIEATQLKRLYSKVYSSGQNSRTYIIHVETTRGEETLVRVNSPEEALFIERTLEDYYNLEDQPQEGEIGGPEINVWDQFFGNR